MLTTAARVSLYLIFSANEMVSNASKGLPFQQQIDNLQPTPNATLGPSPERMRAVWNEPFGMWTLWGYPNPAVQSLGTQLSILRLGVASNLDNLRAETCWFLASSKNRISWHFFNAIFYINNPHLRTSTASTRVEIFSESNVMIFWTQRENHSNPTFGWFFHEKVKKLPNHTKMLLSPRSGLRFL